MGRDLGRASSLGTQGRPRRTKRSRGPARKAPGPRGTIALLLIVVALVLVWKLRSEPPASAPMSTPEAETVTAAKDGGESLSEAILAEPKAGREPVTTPQRYGPPDPFNTIAVKLQRGETLFQSLMRGGLPRAESSRIVESLQTQVDFRTLRPGDRFEGMTWLGEELIQGTFRHGRLDRYRVERSEAGLVAIADPVPVRRTTAAVEGEVASSLFEAIYAVGERPALIMAFVNLFRWDFDFSLETRAGDRFQMLVEKEYVEDRFFGYGPILAARYLTRDQTLEACWYSGSGEDAVAGHYHPDGSSVRRAFLRAPLSFTRISSGYTLSRLHPVLKIRRPHRGIDYAAPWGTPVYAVGAGTVIGAGRMGGAGKAVRIRHPNGWITSYSHLSRILVRRGQRVVQGQKIGKVGSSGYSTGPHLDYRIKINGRFVNPLRVNFPKGDPIPRAERDRFVSTCAQALDQLDGRLGGQAVALRETDQ